MEKVSIIFLPVPPSLSEEKVNVDPSILLPAELQGGEKFLNPENLSWEMILSAMLKLISASSRKNQLNFIGIKKDIPSDHLLSDGIQQQVTTLKSGEIITINEINKVPPEWIDYYRQFVLSVKPEIYHEFTNATIVKAGNGEFDMALEINELLEGLFPGSPGILLNRALILENKAASLEKNGHEAEKENAEALEAYEIAISAKPVLPDTLFNSGFFFMRQRNFARAKESFSGFISLTEEQEIPPDTTEEKIKQAKKIIRDIESQGLDDDSFREAYNYINSGEDEKGLLKIREFIESHPKVWNGWFVLGWVLRKLARYDDSLTALKKAVELGGSNSDIQNEMAICLMEQGDFPSARKELELALKEEPENIKIISNLGVLALKAGKKDEADAFFRTVLELDGEDKLARHYLDGTAAQRT
ncbi:MAG: tetratricopeptide repeat protein [Treponema sp.]|nr:tetratricopeptide repeat protein [Treponema sp.]